MRPQRTKAKANHNDHTNMASLYHHIDTDNTHTCGSAVRLRSANHDSCAAD